METDAQQVEPEEERPALRFPDTTESAFRRLGGALRDLAREVGVYSLLDRLDAVLRRITDRRKS